MKKNNSFVLWSVLIVVVLLVLAVLEFDISNTTQSVSNTIPVTTKHTTHTTSTSGPVGTFDGTTFRYTSFDAMVIPSTENYLLTFSAGKLSTVICNSISGSYSAKNGIITSNLISTLRACVSPHDVMPAEQIFSKVLSDKTPMYVFDGQKLSITGSGHTIVFHAFAK
jgi:heat shock protein HslJ